MIVFIVCYAMMTVVSSNELLEQSTQKPESCPENERWVDCELGYCEEKTCDQLGTPIPCPGIAPPCFGGCICAEGLLRNSENVCIPKKDCPSCARDFNATLGNGRSCGKLCSNYNEAKPDTSNCERTNWEYDSCQCKEGYVYNDIVGQCIHPSDCPKPCKGDHYAETKSCVTRCQPTCAEPNPATCNLTCIENGCECIPGYVLEKPGGKCVKIEKCPDRLGCNGDPNAVITNCASPCPWVCEETEPSFCAAVCEPIGCTCRSEYIFSKKEGRCIPLAECDKLKTEKEK